MDTAIYWVEYVLRHNGAHHLKTNALQYSETEYHNLDVLMLLGTIASTSITVSVVLTMITYRTVMKKVKKSEKGQKKEEKTKEE